MSEGFLVQPVLGHTLTIVGVVNADRRPGIPADGAPSRRSAPDF